MLKQTTRTATITLLSIIALTVSTVAQTHKLVSFIVDHNTVPPTITYGINSGIEISYGMPGKFKLTYDPTANNSPNCQIGVSSIGKPVEWHVESPGSDAFDLILKRLTVVGGSLQLVDYDPDELVTVSVDWIDE